MLRKQASRKIPSKRVHTSRRLNLESLEPRQLLSASGFKPDFFKIQATTKASSTNSGYMPAQIRTAYGFTGVSATGAGETIAIIDAYNDPTIASDLATFDSAYGIAAPPSFTVMNQTGGSSLPGTDSSAGWEVEESLDVEWAHAIAPGANIILVEANSASDSDLFTAVNTARNISAVSVISMSWGSDDNIANQANDQADSAKYLVTPAGHQGITFVASAGDDGHPNFPAESPNVLAVGGTDLYLNSNNTISSETAWEPQKSGGQVYSGSGGVSVEFPGRDVPDVSYNAGIGYAIYDSFDGTGGWIDVGGTSAGAPQWAALIALADQGRASSLTTAQTLAALYAAPYSTDFHDITVGSTQFQSAGPGYDLATGLGTPVANNLVPYLTSYGGSGGGSGGTTASTPAAPTNFTATAASSSQINLSWTASAGGATGYDVFELESGKYVLITTTSATSYNVGSLSAGTSYSFEVEAYNTVGSSTATSAPVTATASTKAAVTLAAPTNVNVTAASSTVAQVSWTASAGATGYLVFEKSGTSWVQVWSGTGTSVSVSGQTAGATETFYVEAYIGTATAPTSTASSASVSVVMPKAAALLAPTNVTAKATSSTTGTLSWTDSAGATSYAIYYWNGRQAVYLGSVSSTTTSVTISGMTANTTYQFEVVAVNNTSSAASAWVSLTTPAATASKSAIEYVFSQYGENSRTGWFA